MAEGTIAKKIEQMIETAYKLDRMEWSEKDKCYHPFYDGKYGHQAQAYEEIYNLLLKEGIIS